MRHDEVARAKPSGAQSVVLILAGLAVGLGGCGMRVDVTKTDAGRLATPREEGCSVRFFNDTASLPATCEARARVTLGDTGFSVSCGTGDARRHLRRLACEVAGDTVVTKSRNNSMSTCIGMEATILRCEQ